MEASHRAINGRRGGQAPPQGGAGVPRRWRMLASNNHSAHQHECPTQVHRHERARGTCRSLGSRRTVCRRGVVEFSFSQSKRSVTLRCPPLLSCGMRARRFLRCCRPRPVCSVAPRVAHIFPPRSVLCLSPALPPPQLLQLALPPSIGLSPMPTSLSCARSWRRFTLSAVAWLKFKYDGSANTATGGDKW